MRNGHREGLELQRGVWFKYNVKFWYLVIGLFWLSNWATTLGVARSSQSLNIAISDLPVSKHQYVAHFMLVIQYDTNRQNKPQTKLFSDSQKPGSCKTYPDPPTFKSDSSLLLPLCKFHICLLGMINCCLNLKGQWTKENTVGRQAALFPYVSQRWKMEMSLIVWNMGTESNCNSSVRLAENHYRYNESVFDGGFPRARACSPEIFFCDFFYKYNTLWLWSSCRVFPCGCRHLVLKYEEWRYRKIHGDVWVWIKIKQFCRVLFWPRTAGANNLLANAFVCIAHGFFNMTLISDLCALYTSDGHWMDCRWAKCCWRDPSVSNHLMTFSMSFCMKTSHFVFCWIGRFSFIPPDDYHFYLMFDQLNILKVNYMRALMCGVFQLLTCKWLDVFWKATPEQFHHFRVHSFILITEIWLNALGWEAEESWHKRKPGVLLSWERQWLFNW